MHNSKRIRRMIIAIALIIVILLGLDYLLYPCTFMRNDIHTVTTQKYGKVVTRGGRVIAVSSYAANKGDALAQSYTNAMNINFD